jgi:hypothetical protein
VQRRVPFALKLTAPMATDGNPDSDRVTGELAVIHIVDVGTDEELRIEIVKAVWVPTTSVAEFDDVEPE